MTLTTRFALVASAVLAACSGSEAVVVQDGTDPDDGDVAVVEGEALKAELAQGASRVHEGSAIVRVGMMIYGVHQDAVEIRAAAPAGEWTAWKPVTITYAEGETAVAYVDVTPGSTKFQWRVKEGAELPKAVAISGIPVLGENAATDGDAETSSASQALSFGIIPRSSWGARSPTCSSGIGSAYRFTVHHSVEPIGADPAAQIRGIQRFHMDVRGYCDIAYNFVVSRDGRIWEGRGARTLGGHTGGANTGNIGVCYLGDYTNMAPTSDQICGGAELLRQMHSIHPAITFDRGHVFGHRNFGQTACPGNLLYPQVDEIVRRAASGSCGGGGPVGGSCDTGQTAACGGYGCGCVNGACNGGTCPGTGCSSGEAAACGAYGAGCVDHACNGGTAPGTGCTWRESHDCGGYGANCVDHQCNGGTAPGTGCTWLESKNCGAYGANCVDHKCNGGTAPGSGCTLLETNNCGAYGANCVDHKCNGGTAPGSGCTLLETNNCGAYGAGCVDHKCNGGTAPGSGCTLLETNNCGAYACGCSDHKCGGGACPGTGCTFLQTKTCTDAGKTCSRGSCI